VTFQTPTYLSLESDSSFLQAETKNSIKKEKNNTFFINFKNRKQAQIYDLFDCIKIYMTFNECTKINNVSSKLNEEENVKIISEKFANC